jgi:hypothetical protein
MYGNAAYNIIGGIPVVYRLKGAAIHDLVIFNLKSVE